MSKSAGRARALTILEQLETLYADLTTGLNFNTPFELLIATILSAQCTDERVNLVTPHLFARYPTAEALANAERSDVEAIIHSCGFFRNKAKNIQAAAARIQDRFGGQVPATMAELITLPGVARKTANVVLAHAFGRHEGIAVDTHVLRLSNRLAMTTSRDPVQVEQDLMLIFPTKHWGRVSDTLIWHGRRLCSARRPLCADCPVQDLCPSAHHTTG
ncbi:MAG: endonuclease III [Chloroflexota bacterium]